MNLVAEQIEVVVVPESAKMLSFEGALAVKKDWLRAAAEEPELEPGQLHQCQQPTEAFPLEVVKPNIMRYRTPDSQTVEAKLPSTLFRLLEYVMGQEGRCEHFANVAATLWPDDETDKTDSIHQAKTRVNQKMAENGIPFSLKRINSYIVLVSKEMEL